MDDITPELLEALQKAFEEFLGETGFSGLSYADAQAYADIVSTALSKAFVRELRADILLDGKLYWNIPDRVVRPLLEQEYLLAAEAAQQVQQALNQAAGLGLKAQAAQPDTDSIDTILHKVSEAERYDDISWMLDEPVKRLGRSVVDETLRRNVEFQGRSGLSARIVRRAESHCCKRCSNLAGTYTYPDVPRDAYRRHNFCRCVVEYDPGSGRRQNAHTKQWTEPEEVLEARKKARCRD